MDNINMKENVLERGMLFFITMGMIRVVK